MSGWRLETVLAFDYDLAEAEIRQSILDEDDLSRPANVVDQPALHISGGQSRRFQSVLSLGSALGSVKTETVGSVKTVRNVQKR